MSTEIVFLTPGDPWVETVDQHIERRDVIGEVAQCDGFLWAAMLQDGEPTGAHRAVVANDCLYLRGVYAFAAGRSLTAYPLARALLRQAADRGLSRSHVWLETQGRERNTALLLKARRSATPLHRFRLPVDALGTGPGTSALPNSARGSHAPALMLDGRCAVLHGPFGDDGFPGEWSPSWLDSIAHDLDPRVESVEVAVPTTDVVAGLGLLARGGRRVNRCSVYHGTVPLGGAS